MEIDTYFFQCDGMPTDRQILHEEVLQVQLGGINIPVRVRIMSSFRTLLDFTFIKNPYTFDIMKWMGCGQANMYRKFHNAVQRDVVKYGTIDDDGSLNLTLDQKRNVIVQASRDVMACLDVIFTMHQREVIDYAIWYIDHYQRAQNINEYGKYITKITCQRILHTNFASGSVNYQVSEFQP